MPQLKEYKNVNKSFMVVHNTLKPFKVHNRKSWWRFKRNVSKLVNSKAFKNYCNRTVMSNEIIEETQELLFHNQEHWKLYSDFAKILCVHVKSGGPGYVWVVGLDEDVKILNRFAHNLNIATLYIKGEAIEQFRLTLPIVMGELSDRRYKYIMRYVKE